MSDILTRCFRTGQVISTGITTETIVFESLPNIWVPVRCPVCGAEHRWRPDMAWVDGEDEAKWPDYQKRLYH